MLHDALYGALIDAGERLAVTASSAWRGEQPLEGVQEAAAEVLALHRLLRTLESLGVRPDGYREDDAADDDADDVA